MITFKQTAIVALLASGFFMVSPSWAISYTFIDLGTLGSGLSVANGINNMGQIAGYSDGISGGHKAVLWNGATITVLGTLPLRQNSCRLKF